LGDASAGAAIAGSRTITVCVPQSLYLLLFESLEICDWTKLSYSSVGSLIFLDLRQGCYSLSDLTQFREPGCLTREQESEVVDYLVNGKIEDGQISEVKIVGHALALVQLHQMLDFSLVQLIQLFPSVQSLLTVCRPHVAQKTNNCVLEVSFRSETVYFHLMFDSSA